MPKQLRSKEQLPPHPQFFDSSVCPNPIPGGTGHTHYTITSPIPHIFRTAYGPDFLKVETYQIEIVRAKYVSASDYGPTLPLLEPPKL